MPRRARVIAPGCAHHVTQRGNYRQIVFETPRDYRIYLYFVAESVDLHRLSIHAYCLMPNHVHFIITPKDRDGMAALLRNVHSRYSHYKNAQKQRVGHLWQGRYYSCIMDEAHLFRGMRYVEMNPVRAGMCAHPVDHVWSSARGHMDRERHPILATTHHELFDEYRGDPAQWESYLLANDDEMVRKMRTHTAKGWALGDDDFITSWEKKLGVPLRPKGGQTPLPPD